MKLKVFLLAIVLIIVAAVLVTTTKMQKDRETRPLQPEAVATSTQTYSIAEIALHSSVISCWTTVNGKVYDLTSWIKDHPGGQQAILGICGKDGSEAFNSQHGGQEKQAEILATFQIGSLRK